MSCFENATSEMNEVLDAVEFEDFDEGDREDMTRLAKLCETYLSLYNESK